MPERTLHGQLADDLQRRIRAGEWPVGASLPSEKALSEETGVSRHTLRHALATLRDRGLLEMRQGAPTKVISCTQPRVYSQDFNTLREVLRYPASTVRENNHESYIECDAKLQPLLQAPLGSSWYHIGAVRRDEALDKPVAWADIYILGKFARVTKLKNHPREIVFEQIERHFGVSIDRALVEVQAASLTREHAAYLDAPVGSPCLVITRRYFDSAGHPFEVTVTRHVPDRFNFSLELRSVGRPAGA